MRKLILALALFTGLSASATEPFPKAPNPELTPGALCEDGRKFRYPEQIRYCSRDVSSSLKREIIQTYDKTLGYSVGQMDRKKFKIDHYIPLCMGGSNEAENLWPQHESVYQLTDLLEQSLCLKMAEGKLRQAEAVEIIKRAKNDLAQASGILDDVRNR